MRTISWIHLVNFLSSYAGAAEGLLQHLDLLQLPSLQVDLSYTQQQSKLASSLGGEVRKVDNLRLRKK